MAAYYNKTQIKKYFGWTESMVKKLLPPHDLEVPNPLTVRYPIKKWKRETIENAMRSEEYARMYNEAQKRRAWRNKGN